MALQIVAYRAPRGSPALPLSFTDTEDTATATTGNGRRSFDAAVWKFEGEYRRFDVGVWSLIFELRAHLILQSTHCRARYGRGGHGYGDSDSDSDSDSGLRQTFFQRR